MRLATKIIALITSGCATAATAATPPSKPAPPPVKAPEPETVAPRLTQVEVVNNTGDTVVYRIGCRKAISLSLVGSEQTLSARPTVTEVTAPPHSRTMVFIVSMAKPSDSAECGIISAQVQREI